MKHWDDLRVFLAVARQGSISGAAKRLGVNHSTVSRRLNAYEQAVDVRLFERGSNGYTLTANGLKLFQVALEVETRLCRVDDLLHGSEDDTLSGTLTVTLPPALSGEVLMPLFRQFQTRYPELMLNLIASNDLLSLSRMEADVAIRATRTPPLHLVGRQLCSYASTCYVSRERYPQWLAGEDLGWIGNALTEPLPDWLLRYYGNARRVATIFSTTSRLAAVRAGLGAAELPCFLAEGDAELVRVPNAQQRLLGEIWLLAHPHSRGNRKVQALLSFLPGAFAELKPMFEGLAG